MSGVYATRLRLYCSSKLEIVALNQVVCMSIMLMTGHTQWNGGSSIAETSRLTSPALALSRSLGTAEAHGRARCGHAKPRMTST